LADMSLQLGLYHPVYTYCHAVCVQPLTTTFQNFMVR
jgi:hypothetical protein